MRTLDFAISPKAFGRARRRKVCAASLGIHYADEFIALTSSMYDDITKTFGRVPHRKRRHDGLGAQEKRQVSMRTISETRSRSRNWCRFDSNGARSGKVIEAKQVHAHGENRIMESIWRDYPGGAATDTRGVSWAPAECRSCEPACHSISEDG